MNELIYWGVVIAGAVALLIEANRSFRESLTDTPFEEHPILKGVEVAKLCTSAERNLGFAFYSLFYLAIYVLLLSSTEVFELLSNATQSGTQVGPTDALDGDGEDPLGLVSAGYGKPIFISSTIIALVSTNVVKPIERTIRSLSHRLAGIPRGVYAVMESLHGIDFSKYHSKGQPTRLDSMFDATFLANRTQLNSSGHSRQQIATIREALLTIDTLAPALTGQLRELYFPIQNLDAMSGLSDKLELQITELEGILRKPAKDAESELAELFNASKLNANDTIALFAVQFIRNNRAIKEHDRGEALKRVREEIGLDYQVELNSFGMSILLSTFAAILFGFWLVWSWHSYGHVPFQLAKIEMERNYNLEQAANPAANGSTAPATAADGSLLCHKLAEAGVAQLLSREDASSAGGAATLDPLTPAERSCARQWGRTQDLVRNELRYLTAVFSFKEAVSVLFAIVLAALTALLGREVRKEDNSWPSWTWRRIPFLRLISISLVPAVLAVVGIAFGSFIIEWIGAGFHMTESQMTTFFQTRSTFFVMHGGLGLIIALGVIVLSDQHDHLYNEATYLLGMAFGVAAVFYYSVIVLLSYPATAYIRLPEGAPALFTFHVREAIRYGSCAFFFLLFYSIFVEFTEQKKGKRSLIFSALRTGRSERKRGTAT